MVAGVGDHLEIWGRRALDAQQQAALDDGIEEVTEALGDPS